MHALPTGLVAIKQIVVIIGKTTKKKLRSVLKNVLFQADHLFYEKMGRSEEACIEVGNIVIKVIVSVESSMSL